MITKGMAKQLKIMKVISLFLISLLPKLVFSVELSDVRVYSLLNEPLNAEITLSQIKSISPEDIRVSVAERDVYADSGLEPLSWLYTVKFHIIKNPDTGKTILKMTTLDPVKDPYIDLLLVTTWPSGKIIREYTLLLDPPKIALSSTPLSSPKPLARKSTYSAEPIVEAVVTVDNEYLAEAPGKVASRVKQRAHSRRLERAHSRVIRPGGRYGPIYDETLWSIAKRLVENTPFSVYQGVAAIAEKNPSAFKYGNINYFSEGTVLSLPTVDELSSFSRQEAQRFVEAQNEDWQQSNIKLTKAPESRSKPQSEKKLERSRKPLRLVAPEPETPLETKSSKRISMIEEEMDTLKRSNEDINQKNEYLKHQNESLSAIVSSKDQEIEKLKEALQKGQVISATTPVPAPIHPSTEEFAIAVPDTKKLSVPSFPEPGMQNMELVEKPVIVPASKPEVKVPPPAPVEAAKTRKSSEVASKEARSTEKPKDSVKSFLLWLIILFTLLFAFSIGFWTGKRPLFVLWNKLRKKQPQKPEETTQASVPSLASMREHVHFDLEKALAALSQEEKRYLNLQTNKEPAPKEDISLEDVDVYIAYERYAQAEKILQGILLKNPSQWDALLKLLELYVLTEDYQDFQRWYKTAPADLNDLAPRVWSRIELLKSKVENEKAIQLEEDESSLTSAKQTPVSSPLDTENFDLSKKYSLSLEETELPHHFQDTSNELRDLLPEVTAEQTPEKPFSVAEEPQKEESITEESKKKLQPLVEESDSDIQSEIALAKAYIDIGDYDSARDYLMKALAGGSAAQKQQVQEMLDRLNKQK